MVKCNSCGFKNPGGKFCSQCGAMLESGPLICPKCKAENPPGSKFCNECGANLISTSKVGSPKAKDSKEKNRKNPREEGSISQEFRYDT